MNLDYAKVKNVDGTSVHTLLIGRGPRGETFARSAPRKGARIDDFERFVETMKSRYGQILCMSDQEEVLLHVARPVALKLGLPTGASPAERPQTNGRAEQRARSMKQRLHIIIAETWKKGSEVLESLT